MHQPHTLKRLAEIEKLQASLATPPGSFLRDLQRSYERRDLHLVLGAGVSVPYGIPTWPKLLQKLLSAGSSVVTEDTFYSELGMNPIILARYLRQKRPDHSSFLKDLHKALYEDANFGTRLPLTTEILQFCANTGYSPPICGVINYNFDTSLEYFIAKSDLSVPFNSVSKDDNWPTNDNVTIYHPHGVIPFTDFEKGAVIFDEVEYHNYYRESINLSNIVQYNAFSRGTCLFIGVSLTDPNMRRLLDFARPHRPTSKLHFMFRRIPKPSVTNLTVRDYERLVKGSIDVLSTDGEHFGIRTIWVATYEDIPCILRQIRESR